MQHLFLHVPKTAGSSMRTLLQQNYPADRMIGFSGDPAPLAWFRDLPADVRQGYALVHGHFPFGLHPPGGAYTYFTLLRDPVARHFSEYQFLRRYADHPLHDRVAGGEITLADWATIFSRYPSYCDVVTGLVSGEGVVPRPEAVSRQPDSAMLARAKFNLLRDFTFVGLTERFDESVLMIARRLGWRSVFYLRRNVGPSMPVPEPLRRQAAARLSLDIDLYHFAREHFENTEDLRDPLFLEALAEFRDVTEWLGTAVRNRPEEEFVVGDALPSLDELARARQPLKALDRYLSSPAS